MSSKQAEKSNTHATLKRNFNNLSAKYPIGNNLLNASQNIDNEFVGKAAQSSINFNFANIQTKLRVNEPGDVYEQEADRIAEKIMKSSHGLESGLPIKALDNTRIDRKCKSCEQGEEEEENQMKISKKENSYANSTNKLEISEGAEKEISNTLNQPGSPLDSSTREFMESRFGYDFGKVRIHNDETTVKSASAINSLSYTIGNDIVFNEGQYRPNSGEGRKLLAHELTHVIQQDHSFSASTKNILNKSNGLDVREIDNGMPNLQLKSKSVYIES